MPPEQLKPAEASSGQRYLVNAWISFLREYGPIPQNNNMYDETIQGALRRAKVQPLEFETGDLLKRILADLNATPARSVLLTGTAGDGKTYLCREAWIRLGGKQQTWEKEGKVKRLKLETGKTLYVIKDLSELGGSDYKYLEKMAQSVLDANAGELFLVAANDGQLVEAWGRAKSSDAVLSFRAAIEELLVTDASEKDGFQLRLHNLSRTDSAAMMTKILESIRNHPGWRQCDGCLGQTTDPKYRCPIWENLQRLGDSLFRERLFQLLTLSDQDGYHLPIRQLLILASNLLLGNSDARNGLLQCRDIPGIIERNAGSQASIYRNVFGGNLSPDRRANTEVFSVFGRFGIGDETSNQIDNLLVFGADDPKLTSTFDRIIRQDPLYGGSSRFLTLQAAYLEGEDENEIKDFLDELPGARQRLFFTIPDADARKFALWELTVFHFAGEYLEQVLIPLQRGDWPPRHLLDRLVRGINRIFTGILVSASRELVLTSSISYSQARISPIQEHAISIEPNRGEKVTIEMSKNRPCLAVYLDRDHRVPLMLNLVKYEFLSRVAEGALPTSFSRECYEDLLSFKTRLLQHWSTLQQEYGEDRSGIREVTIRVIELDPRGTLIQNPISLKV